MKKGPIKKPVGFLRWREDKGGLTSGQCSGEMSLDCDKLTLCIINPKVTCCCCLVAQSCPTLRDPMHCSPPGASVHGSSQARILEWTVISFSRGSF